MAVIEMHLGSVQQLFDSLDPSPFHQKALDRNAEAWLVDSAGEHADREPLRLLVHGPESMKASMPEVSAAIHTHFRLARDRLDRQGRRRVRRGLNALVAGLLLLALTLLARYALRSAGVHSDVLSEGLLIIGWVGMWRPAELLLFDRLESSAERALLDRLSRVPVEFRVHGPAPDAG